METRAALLVDGVIEMTGTWDQMQKAMKRLKREMPGVVVEVRHVAWRGERWELI